MTSDSNDFARQQTAALIDRLAGFVEQVQNEPNEDAVHDLRVTIRRLSAALRIFAPVFGKKRCRRYREQLKALMAPAGATRDRDVTVKLLRKAGVPAASELSSALKAQGVEFRGQLQAAAAGLAAAGFPGKWRRRLGIE